VVAGQVQANDMTISRREASNDASGVAFLAPHRFRQGLQPVHGPYPTLGPLVIWRHSHGAYFSISFNLPLINDSGMR
jgi:hypothetical protein